MRYIPRSVGLNDAHREPTTTEPTTTTLGS